MTLSYLRRCKLPVLLLTLAFTVLYGPVFIALIRRWSGSTGSDDYGHGFLVPLIFAYLVWSKRKQLMELRVTPAFRWGIPVMILAGFTLILGKLGSIIVLEEMSLIVMVTGLILLIMGTTYLKVLALPVSYLVFMVPIFDEVIDQIHWPFQLLAAAIGSWLLQSLGFSVFHEAQYIQLPRITLEVAEVCSGIKYLISVLAIGIPLAYLTQRTWRRRIGLVAFGVIVAILSNGLRVALIGVWVQYSGPSVLHGPFKTLQGLFVAWIGFVAIFAGAWFLGLDPERRRALAPSRAASGPKAIHGICQETGEPL